MELPELPAGYSFGQMAADELPVLAGWAQAEGWNPGVGDLEVAWSVDPDAFLALRSVDGELAGAGTVLSYDGAMGFMGLFIVRDDLRGHGLGTKLWHHRVRVLSERLRPGAPNGMDGVFDMVPFYEQGGFVLSHRDLRFEGAASGTPGPDVVDAAPVPFNQLAAFDAAHLGVDRSAFLRAWSDRPGVQSFAVTDDEGVSGYAVLRPCASGFKTGPFLATTPAVAEQLLGSVLHAAEGEQVQVDVPEPNTHAVRMMQSLGFTESFGCARMYRGPAPDVPVGQVYGVTSFEFG
jgi:GNAT superfamily N-acetyltransferase